MFTPLKSFSVSIAVSTISSRVLSLWAGVMLTCTQGHPQRLQVMQSFLRLDGPSTLLQEVFKTRALDSKSCFHIMGPNCFLTDFRDSNLIDDDYSQGSVVPTVVSLEHSVPVLRPVSFDSWEIQANKLNAA